MRASRKNLSECRERHICWKIGGKMTVGGFN